jgi:hypothetical protein
MFSDLALFLLALWNHWQALVTGGLLAVAVMLIDRARKQPLSWRTFGIIMGLALLWSCFEAWQEEHTRLVSLKADLTDARLALSEARGDLKASQTNNAEKDKRIGDLQLLLDQKPAPQQQQPIINVRPGPPAPSTERSWLVISNITPDFTARPFKVILTISNTGQIPALGFQLASGVTIDKAAKPDLANRQTVHTVIPNGFSSTVTVQDWDTQLLPEIQAGTVPLFLYLKIEYFDEAAKARKPLEMCSFWSPTSKTFSQCLE